MKTIVSCIGIALIFFINGCAYLPTGNVTHNVYFADKNMSNATPQEVEKFVKAYYLNESKEIKLIDKTGKIHIVRVQETGFYPDIPNTVWSIRSYGYEPHMASLVKSRWYSLFNKHLVTPQYKYDKTINEAFYTQLAKVLHMPSPRGKLEVHDGKVVYQAPPIGEIIDKDKTNKEILQALTKGIKNPINIIYTQGISYSSEAQELKAMTAILSTYTTHFNTGAVNRSHNIALATEKVNGIMIPPGGTFSYNSIVGERTEAAGFESAPVIIDGKLEPGIGGGICQLSSTLFNAALYSGMDIIQRTPHYEPVSYVAPGHDATVSYGSLDFVFKNPFTHSIYVLAHLHGGTLTIYILGNPLDAYKKVTVQEVSRRTIKNKVITKEDHSIEGTKIEEEGHPGLLLVNRRSMIKNDGTVISDTYESYYDPMDKIIIKGKSKPKEVLKKREKDISTKK